VFKIEIIRRSSLSRLSFLTTYLLNSTISNLSIGQTWIRYLGWDIKMRYLRHPGGRATDQHTWRSIDWYCCCRWRELVPGHTRCRSRWCKADDRRSPGYQLSRHSRSIAALPAHPTDVQTTPWCRKKGTNFLLRASFLMLDRNWWIFSHTLRKV